MRNGQNRRIYFGKYMGKVRDIHDPMMLGRLRLEVPFPLGVGEDCWSVWALPCLPPGGFSLPEEGDGVWVEFMNGDINSPIWSGVYFSQAGMNTTAPFQSTHAVLTDMDDAEVDRDKADHASNPYDNEEHKEWHNHTSEFYDPHYFGMQSHTGHTLEFKDHPGRGAWVKLQDRFGRVVEMLATGLTRLAGYRTKETEWSDLEGADYPEKAPELEFGDLLNETPDGEGFKFFVKLKDMAGAALKFISDPGEEHIKLSDFWGQNLTIHSVAGEEYVEVVDKEGQKIRFDVTTGTVTVEDKNANKITMAEGKVVIEVAASSNVHIGGESGQELVTKNFLTAYYANHTHPTSTGPSGPPIVPVPMTPGINITKKQKSE